MILIPAVDILGGRPVRLLHGEYDRVTQYGGTPLEAALRWKAAGAEWLHVVDLDGARSGEPVNGEALRQILESSGLKVQAAGGLRTREAVDRVLGWGAERVVLGTRAVADAEWLREVCAAYPGRVVAALDARGGVVALQGWTESSGVPLLEAARAVEAAGVSHILSTAIETDGAMTGPDLRAIEELLAAVSVPVIASGGVATKEHLELLARAGVEAVIVGRALYEGAIPPEVVRQYAR